MPLWGETTKMAKLSLKVFAEFWAWTKKGQSQTPKRMPPKSNLPHSIVLRNKYQGVKPVRKRSHGNYTSLLIRTLEAPVNQR